MAFDFSPRPHGFNAPAARDSFDATAARLAERAESVCRYLLPAGRRNGPEYECGDVAGNKGKSLKVHIARGENCGLWKDFDSGDGGHDLIALWATVRGIKMVEAKQEAERWLGVDRAPKANNAAAPKANNAPPADDDNWWRNVKPTKTWDYFDADGVLFGTVYRFDDPTGKRKKEIRPWNGKEWKSPEGLRPLYNLPAILRAPPDATIVLVEGEKCADAISALADSTVISTTSWGGAAAALRTDWSPLKGRHVVRWPDNDHPNADGKPTGREVWLRTTKEHIEKAGPASLRDLIPPEGKPDGWDAADADPEERRALVLGVARQPAAPTPPRVTIKAMTAASLFLGKKPREPEWLVENVIPYGRGGLFAAPGDTGKGMLMVDLAVKVATPAPAGFDSNPPMAFGHKVCRRGAVVILSAEDDTDELHRRVLALHPKIDREAAARLHFLPYPDMPGRAPTYMAGDADGVEPTQELRDVYGELKEIDGLALVIMDPLAAFAGIDLTAPSASQQVGNAIDKLGKDLNCTVIAPHHLVKGEKRSPIETVEDARRAISGAGQLLNAVRFAYSMWAPDQLRQREVLTALGRDFLPNEVFMGAVVKSNAKADRSIATYARNAATGLLEIVDPRKLSDLPLAVDDLPPRIADMAIQAVGHFANAGKPATKNALCFPYKEDKTGKVRAGELWNLMPAEWRDYRATDGKSLARIMDALIYAKHIKRMGKHPFCLYLPGDNWDKGQEGGGWDYPKDLSKKMGPPDPFPGVK